MNYYIADTHFGHKNCLTFDYRPFESVEEMDRIMIDAWNSTVGQDDEVYILGDFCFKSSAKSRNYLSRLTGKKYLITGNHDGVTLKDEEARKYFEIITPYLVIYDEGERIVLCHYPIAEWEGMRKGAWHIYGHIHANRDETFEFMKTRERALNAGCMINNYCPVTFKQLIQNNKVFLSKTN